MVLGAMGMSISSRMGAAAHESLPPREVCEYLQDHESCLRR